MIGTLATEAGRQGIITYMMTPDKDYGQLVSDNVFMYRPKHSGGFEVMGIEEIKNKFNIRSTEQVIDMLGLMGDSSDNIPGCPGVGEKTAQKLVAEFGSIENLLAHTDRLKGALKTKVEANREMIAFSKFLATIKVDVPIKLDMNTLVREEHHAAAQDVDTVEDAADRHGGGGAEVQFPGEGSEAHARLIARYAVAGQNHHFRHDRVDLAGHDGRTGGHGRQTDFAEPRPGTRGQQAEIVGDLSRRNPGEYLECA